jgi:hypothetical protein
LLLKIENFLRKILAMKSPLKASQGAGLVRSPKGTRALFMAIREPK